ncbi:MAG: glycogen/starch/alpha-glucan phosphorylase [Blastocatellia bacterium]|jgi:starch phosphorylase|nr:glycogen/starch/alpha-glucan phosphorylase [Blastocatellia bacterium]
MQFTEQPDSPIQRPAPRRNGRAGRTADALEASILENLHYDLARLPETATANDWYLAVALTVRDRMIDNWIEHVARFNATDRRIVGYLSAEFLLGPHLGNNVVNLGIEAELREAVGRLGVDYDTIAAQEEEPGLGNGGLGRLAACYLDSLATLEIPAIGYGIRYEFGIFDQSIENGWQVEVTDKWLARGNPWEIARPEMAYAVGFGGTTTQSTSENGRLTVTWSPARVVKGVAYDTPISGYRVAGTTLLRLWKSEAVESFDFEAFNLGEYGLAVDEKVKSETISKVLYPNDNQSAGKRLRLAQQYFFVTCSLQDMLKLHLAKGEPIARFADRFAVQLNDTHPSIAVAELMRLLVDVHDVDWDEAWRITEATLGYTNHTLLPEALEKWPLDLFAELLPRHLEIIFEINHRFLDEVRAKFPGDETRVARMSIIDESGGRFVRMAHLACVGSNSINGVAELHSRLLKETVLVDFHDFCPEKFCNVTNGVTPRRWVVLANPGQTALVSGRIGDAWICDPARELPRLEPLADDPGFRDAWMAVKAANKVRLAGVIRDRTGIVVDPSSLYDVQVKRFHEYKRQHLNALHVIALYNRIRSDAGYDAPPRTVLFGGKAAPGYQMAKLIIKLLTSIAEVVNNDPATRDRLKLVFFPDFNVTHGQLIYPAANLSEQISTAGKEASGTGNMKFAMNGALTIGTLDGANVEILECVGDENFFLFGLTTEGVADLRARGYRPVDVVRENAELGQVIDQIASGFFSGGDRDLFRPIVDALLNRDEYLALADFSAYLEAQQRVSDAYQVEHAWARSSILNVARTGKFSSDRSIRDYADLIWKTGPV